MNSLIEIKQVQKQMDDFTLGPVNLTIEPGTITTIVGNNGAGKSTLLKMLMNLVKPDSGSINILGESVSQSEEWKEAVAYQPQTMVGSDSYTGKTLRSMTAMFYPKWDESLFKKVVQLLDIPLTKQYQKMSPGSRQKLTFALTIARNTSILILDEPTAHIDIPAKKIMIDLIVDWMEEQDRAVIISTHQIEDIRKLSDYLFVLHDGEVIGHFEKEQLTESYQQYWLDKMPPLKTIPGEVSREHHFLISHDPERTEYYFTENCITWNKQTSVELGDIITILLTNNGKDESAYGTDVNSRELK